MYLKQMKAHNAQRNYIIFWEVFAMQAIRQVYIDFFLFFFFFT